MDQHFSRFSLILVASPSWICFLYSLGVISTQKTSRCKLLVYIHAKIYTLISSLRDHNIDARVPTISVRGLWRLHDPNCFAPVCRRSTRNHKMLVYNASTQDAENCRQINSMAPAAGSNIDLIQALRKKQQQKHSIRICLFCILEPYAIILFNQVNL